MAITLGRVRTILTDGDPLLATPSEPATIDEPGFSDELGDLAATLADFRARHGFGRAISAPQIGWMRRVIVCDLGSGPRALCNPAITWRSDETQVVWDDCLSVPGRLVRVERAMRISLRWTDETGVVWSWDELPPDMAELFQHEIDHLDGVLMLDHVSGPGDVAPMERRNELIGNELIGNELIDDAGPARTDDPMATEAVRIDEVVGGTTWQSVDTAAYDDKWRQMAAEGRDPHGEVAFVQRFAPSAVLDAGCGTGRVAIELAARGVEVVGVDVDGPMIEAARAKAPTLDFRLDDLATVELGRTFDAVVLAGNVMIFVTPGTEGVVVANLARHVAVGGVVVAGFQLGHGVDVEQFEQHGRAVGLQPFERWATWDGDPTTTDDDYTVVVLRRP